ncbi:MAG: hypothetical protein J6Y48_12815, partial [Clostridia bacterium]|nr:hypothetical protein [Clostridia bacterium]
PLKIGVTPDRGSQTIAEWAVQHGYEKLMVVDIYSPVVDENPTRNALCRTSIRGIEQDGSAILDVSGSLLPGETMYDLSCSVTNLAIRKSYDYIGIYNQFTTYSEWSENLFLKVSLPVGEEMPVTRN